MTEVFAGLAGGLLSSGHCAGMCGGFAAALGASALPWRVVAARQIVYGLGRVFTYLVLGALAGWAGLYLTQFTAELRLAQRLFSILAGVLMILLALSVMGVLRWTWGPPDALSRLLAPMFRQCLSARSLPGFFGAGMANGLLPCGLVYAFLALAAGQASVGAGMALMAGFGLGTMPMLVAIGCGSRMLSAAARLHIFRMAACFVLVLGAVTIYRGLPAAGACCAVQPEATGP